MNDRIRPYTYDESRFTHYNGEVWDCPTCGFSFPIEYQDDKSDPATWSCPACEVLKARDTEIESRSRIQTLEVALRRIKALPNSTDGLPDLPEIREWCEAALRVTTEQSQ